MTKELVEPIVKSMNKEFDSHDFIKEFIWKNPVPYAILLIRYDDVRTAHRQIALFLLHHAEELRIEKIGENGSDDIFGHPTPCAKWKKLH